MIRRGFTVVELIITITIMGVLITLAVVGLNATQAKARDDERATDIKSIALNLESVYANGSNGTNAPTIKNQFVNPSAEASVGTYTVSFVTASQSTVWKSHGTSSVALTPNNGASDSFMAITDSPGGTLQNGMQAGHTYTASGTIHLEAAQTGSLDPRARMVQIYYQTPSGYTSFSSAQAPNVAGTTMRLSVTATIPGDAFEAFVRFYNGASSGGGVVYWDSMMLVEGSTAYDYNDGSSSGWSWTGSANTSMSTGPAISAGVAGHYPSTAMLVSQPVLSATLGDVDTKVLLPPGVSDPLTGFIPATNGTQTEAGVSPQPTASQYVYQPINSQGELCVDASGCRKFNLYYRTEADNTVHKVTSKHR